MFRNPVLSVVVAFVINGSLSHPASATLDQDNLYGTCCQISVIHPDMYQQTVTAGIAGYLTGIELEIHEKYGTGFMTFSLYEGAATPSTAPIFSQDIDMTPHGPSFVWDVSSHNFGFNVGEVFTFGLKGLGAGDGADFADDVDGQYLRGSLFINGDIFEPPRDLAFRTFVDPFPPSEADFDSDGDVDGDDSLIWQTNFGLADPWGHPVNEYGDADLDGDIDGHDFLIWQTDYGMGSNALVTIPEPSSALLLLAALACGLSILMKNKQNHEGERLLDFK